MSSSLNPSMYSDIFRPKLPLDPFPNDSVPEPWQLDYDTLLSLAAGRPSRNVILFLGEPPLSDLQTLIRTPSLVCSLLIVVTHAPPELSIAECSVRILRISTPVFELGAVGLVGVLQKAEMVARQWRASSSGAGGIVQLRRDDWGNFTVEENVGFSPPTSKLSQSSSMPSFKSRPTSSMSFSSTRSSGSSGSRLQFRSQNQTKPTVQESRQRTFDTVINFLPAHLEEKAILKHSVLITTLSHSFLAPTTPYSHEFYENTPPSSRPSSMYTPNSDSDRKQRRYSSLSMFMNSGPSPVEQADSHISQSTLSLSSKRQMWSILPSRMSDAPVKQSSSPPSSHVITSQKNAHLIHVLPDVYCRKQTHRLSVVDPRLAHVSSTSPKLVQSIEQFLISFSYRLISSSSPPTLSPVATRPSSAASSSSLSSSRSSLNSQTKLSIPTITPQDASMEKPIPYALPTSLVGYIPCASNERGICMLELLILGALDTPISQSVVSSRRSSTLLDNLLQGNIPRAWIGSKDDIQIRNMNNDEGTEVNVHDDLPNPMPPSTRYKDTLGTLPLQMPSPVRPIAEDNILRSGMPTPSESTDSSVEDNSDKKPTMAPTLLVDGEQQQVVRRRVSSAPEGPPDCMVPPEHSGIVPPLPNNSQRKIASFRMRRRGGTDEPAHGNKHSIGSGKKNMLAGWKIWRIFSTTPEQ